MDKAKINYLLEGEILVKGKTFGLWQPKKYIIDQELRIFSIKSSKQNKNYHLANYQIANVERKNNRFQFELVSTIGEKNILMGSDNEKFANELMLFLKKMCGQQLRTQSLFEPSLSSKPNSSIRDYDYDIPHFFEMPEIRDAIQNIRSKSFQLEQYELTQNQIVKIYRNKNNQLNFKVFITLPGNCLAKCQTQLFESQYDWNAHNIKEYTQIKDFKSDKSQMITEIRLIKNWFQFKREFTYLRHVVEFKKKENTKIIIEKKADHKIHQGTVSGLLKFAVWGLQFENNQTNIVLFTEQSYNGLAFIEEDSILSQQYFLQFENIIKTSKTDPDKQLMQDKGQGINPNNSPQNEFLTSKSKVKVIKDAQQADIPKQTIQNPNTQQPIIVSSSLQGPSQQSQVQSPNQMLLPSKDKHIPLIGNLKEDDQQIQQQVNMKKSAKSFDINQGKNDQNNLSQGTLEQLKLKKTSSSQESSQVVGNNISQNILFQQPKIEDDCENDEIEPENEGSDGNLTQYYDCQDDIDAMNDKLFIGQQDQQANSSDQSVIEVRNSITQRQPTNRNHQVQSQSDTIENIEDWVEKKMQAYFSGKFCQIAIDIEHILNPLESDIKNRKYMKEQEGGHYIFRKDFIRDEKNGGLKCINEVKVNAQKSVVKFLLARIGTSLLMGRSLTSISMPVTIFESRSNTERACSSLAFAPVFLDDAAISKDKFYRIKQCAAFSFGFIFSYLSMEKPFNPILGETFQGYFDNCPIYCEQISHHPPICIIQYYGRKYKIDARLELVANFHSNSVVGRNVGEVKVIFENPPQEVIILLAPGCIYGTTFGDKSMDFLEKQFLFDLNNKWVMECAFKPDKKYCQYFNIEHLPYSDFVAGGVCEVTDAAIGRYLREGYRKYKGLDLKSEVKSVKSIIKGVWNQELKFDNQRLISIMTDFPIKLELAQYPLPSDANFRMDVLMWKLRDFDQAQQWKENLEIFQRQDRKLREAMGTKKKKK
ncbi:unnamed protein product (macronuclear) [Paramecium tetraurelia]|uniref:PH domain-containing protein n=1 Tax=Paramecium tetraurelia TaxID=5888 RepID=A0BFJ3_PARTE|nr:uncharacterized protein GSPATT00028345001 [Paramecium tetraurelia]CAK57310.1 unnamed protein product [Paramecium tetraurelia]|eukprot:XP_001424708.1 hypothetical protein (macronuclear) [Paramecium tetraurelia strain d4-2]